MTQSESNNDQSADNQESSSLDIPVELRLKPNRQFPFLARHPWVHAHALAENGHDLTCGQVVDVIDHDGNWVGRGVVNPQSRLRVRLYGFDQSVTIDDDLWRCRIDAAIARRRMHSEFEATGAERLMFSESDLLSGLIVDRYADCLSIQFTAGGLLRWKEPILEHLKSAVSAQHIMVRVDPKTAKHEGIEPIEEWYQDNAPDTAIHYQLNGLQLSVDLRAGQKTGGYLDQRLNHVAAAKYFKDKNVLDVCCYTGGFGLVAAKHGAASITGVDSSQPALDSAAATAAANGITNLQLVKEDCFDALKRLGDAGDKFDAIILDPPRFAGSRHQIDSAMRAYRRLNSLAVDLLTPGGILVTCSCSGRVSRAEFLNMLLDVGRRRRRDLIIMESLGPAPDHPVAVSCPESNYLKCIIAQVN
ncbi:class I SAM-dependent rRNA methyltransferase [Stieleria marina]|uniref:Ribosomal RNA large subunit methyltransferase I n=1 Tax=Stieleria marina TaxID=1930275 RepID=A0A517NPR9_9BACT|nr:Ribosomal RNA large subunit methyltransferase I [Planctomycetes bacterium K23_9]